MQTNGDTPIKKIADTIAMIETGSKTIMDLFGEMMPAIIEIRDPDELGNIKKMLENLRILTLGNSQTVDTLLGYLDNELA